MGAFIFLIVGVCADGYLIYLHFYNPKQEVKKVEKQFITYIDKFKSNSDPLDFIKHMSLADIIQQNKRLRKIFKKYKDL